MGFVIVIDLVDRMIRDNIFLAGQKGTKIGGECLTVATHFGIGSISRNVVHKILSNVRAGSKGEASRV